jgi:hypothetical protein
MLFWIAIGGVFIYWTGLGGFNSVCLSPISSWVVVTQVQLD